MEIQWQGTFELWSRKWLRKNYWRIRHLMPEEDALQECAVTFYRILARYQDTPGMNPAWFMALYKRSVAVDWHILSNKDTKHRGLALPMIDSMEARLQEEEEPEAHRLTDCWASASHDLRAVLAAVANAPADMLALMLPDAPEASALTNNRLKRLAGIHSSSDVVGELKSLLS